MGKKIVRNTFGYAKPGQKKLTRSQATELAISEIEEGYTKRLEREVNLKVADFIGDFCLALAWSLRANHNYGAKRIERTIEVNKHLERAKEFAIKSGVFKEKVEV